MRWQDRVGAKVVSAASAVAKVASGQTVAIGTYTCTPQTLCRALAERGRRGELEGVQIEHAASLFCWTSPELRRAFALHDNFATPFNRAAIHEGAVDYLPISVWQAGVVPPQYSASPDFYLVPVSPPDAHGYCSYGPGVWLSPALVRGAKCVVGEVHPEFIRTGGDNFVHASEIDFFVAAEDEGVAAPPGAPPSEEELAATDTICNLVAAELVRDGDTLQMGIGTVSASLAKYLGFRNDLGIQTELITGGTAELVRAGVVTGRRKSMYPGKVVGSALVALGPEELAQIDGNPAFELYDFGTTDDLRSLSQQKNFVAVNNALVVDLTGQVSAEAFDHRPFTGVGGQTVFMIAGAYSEGGRSVSVLPASSRPAGGARVSRIVAGFPSGTAITVPRTFVDFVVTEFGIAELRGKSLRQRVSALIEIAHPDFREELRSQAKALYRA
ncbi:MAG TPA: acetyl-CoA hydrolase/transferase C-terminal domain-containing protein [Myxococcota bacterium]|nr:acetyl-CoA hydrolase/transferase C-terminal domain-containing protein [Myxococcota bacterium]